MRQIIDRLFLGSRADVLTLEGVEKMRESGIKYVLNVAKEVDYKYPIPDVTVLKIPLNDGEEIPMESIKQAINFIGTSIIKGKILVHCSAGMSRSPSIIIAYLIRIGYSFPSALKIVEGESSGSSNLITPALQLLDSIQEFFGDDLWGTAPRMSKKKT